MPSHLSPERPAAAQSQGRDAVEAVLEQVRRLRGGVEAVRREAGPPRFGDADARARWQRALCDLADSQLNELDAQLGQLRERRPATAGRPAGSLLTRVGTAEWDLLTDRIDWSDELYAIFGRSPEEGPLSLDELPGAIAGADQARLTAMVTDCLVDGRTIDGEFRVVRPDGSLRTVHLVGEPVLDADGATASMWAVLRDVSELRRSQRAVSAPREARGGPPAQGEQRLAVELRETVLPPWRGTLRFPHDEHDSPAGLDLAAHYLCPPGGSSARSDWYDALRLPGDCTLLSVGDLAGRGLSASSGLAMLLGALRGMALTGVDPGPLLGWLNQLLEASAQPLLGSALCCRYDPATRSLEWAQGGHPAPLLFREGTGRALERPAGEVLGAGAQSTYRPAREELLPGDVLVLHTAALNSALDPRSLAPDLTAAADAEACLGVLAQATAGTPGVCLLVARVTG
ncbi:PP2C family protein-serine/threonine phosphatase [Streptomyces polyrhachis]|uniref:PP2C family protein-serine/threonine phosphatase n=1 Tax=Streptomyces polyrhachis TaxID=1282885 RepID=A0ABW2GD77_9ACTN